LQFQQHDVLAAVAAGKHVILCQSMLLNLLQPGLHVYLILWSGGHTNTERGYLPVLASKLRRELQDGEDQGPELTELEVVVSQNDRHPLHFL